MEEVMRKGRRTMKLPAPILIKATALLLALLAMARGPDVLRYHCISPMSPDERLLDGLNLQDREEIELALASGASANAAEPYCQRTALMVAASTGDVEYLRTLLEKGAALHARDRLGMTALAHAAYWGGNRGTEVMCELIKAGAAVTDRDCDGRTPLALASINGREEIVALLLGKGANVEDADADGATPLMLAAASGRTTPSLMILLIEAGADPMRTDKEGRSAFDYAIEAGRDDTGEPLSEIKERIDQPQP